MSSGAQGKIKRPQLLILVRSIFQTSQLSGTVTLIVALATLEVVLRWWGGRQFFWTSVAGAIPIIASLLAGLSLAFGAYWTVRRMPRLRLPWILLAIGAGCWAIGDILNLFYKAVLNYTAFPSLPDVFYLLKWPIALVGILAISGRQRPIAERVHLVLDILILTISAELVAWHFLTVKTDPLAAILVSAYPIGDLVLFWATVMIVGSQPVEQPSRPLLYLSAGFLVAILADAYSAYSFLSAAPAGGSAIQIGKIISAGFLMLAGIQQAAMVRAGNRATRPVFSASAKLWQSLRLGIPFLWLCLSYVLLFVSRTSNHALNDKLALAWVGVIILLVIVRQVIMIGDNYRLTGEMTRLAKELEKRVAERTQELFQANQQLRQEMNTRETVEYLLQERESKLTHFALYDALTDLPNRSLLLDRLALSIRRLKREPNFRFAVLFLDFDGFKVVNDSLGHLAGDQLLVEIASRLRENVREGDTVARLGGDEFAVLVDGIHDNKDALKTVERIQQILQVPFEISGNQVVMTASIGVVYADPSYQQPEDILRDSDLAMYEAKSQGKGRYAEFTAELHSRAVERMLMESDLRLAVERDQLLLYYQPILSLETGQITGFEALLRWRHPERGLMQPGQFISIAESSGLIVPITGWVLKRACQQIAQWQKRHPAQPPLTISVNLSPRLFSYPELTKMVETSLAESGLSPQSLILEITENVIAADAEATIQTLSLWRNLGVRTHMDDFGTGYSSLSYLHQFPIDALKIDRIFVNRIGPEGENSQVIPTIVALAHQMNMEVIAEGIETDVQYRYLKHLGCEGGQGYYIARPLPPEEAEAQLVQRNQETIPLAAVKRS